MALVSELTLRKRYEEFVGATKVFGDLEADAHQVPDFDFFVGGATGEDAAFVRIFFTV